MPSKITYGLILLLLVGLIFSSCRYYTDASDTVFKETKASTLLKKYEAFKDMSAALDAKQESIKVLESSLVSFKDQYDGAPRSQWAREDREEYNLKTNELSGLKISYNNLASEYNSQMSKINWAFCNVGDLPKGASQPLPREYKQYMTE